MGHGNVSAPFDGPAKLAAGHHLLSGIAALAKIHSSHAFEVDHLWHKNPAAGVFNGRHAAGRFRPFPLMHVE